LITRADIAVEVKKEKEDEEGSEGLEIKGSYKKVK
jgi:hypothetical protein